MLDRAIIHIGFTKTGSSSIQETAHGSREALLAQGVIYPGNFRNHFHLEGAFSETPVPKRFFAAHGRTPDEIKRATLAKLAEVRADLAATAARTAIFSHEEFSTMRAEDFARLVAFAREIAREVSVLGYVRHPAEHAVSALQQRVKTGYLRLEEFDPWRNRTFYIGPLERVSAALRPGELELRVFHRDRLYRGDVIDDFFRYAGLDDSGIDTLTRQTRNESVSHEIVLLMDAMNRVLPRMIDGKPNPRRYKRGLDEIYAIRGARFTIPQALASEVVAAAQGQLDKLRTLYGIEFPPPRLPVGDPQLWQAETLEDLALLLNDLLQKAWRLEQLEAEVVPIESGEDRKIP